MLFFIVMSITQSCEVIILAIVNSVCCFYREYDKIKHVVKAAM